MPQLLKTVALAFLAIAISILQSGAQTNRLALDGSGAQRLTALVTNDQVTLSWPAQPVNWQLLEQQPAFTAEWKPVPAELYQTNAFGVSATLPLPAKTSLYRLQRALVFHPAVMPPMPPMPELPTNRTKPLKPPGQP